MRHKHSRQRLAQKPAHARMLKRNLVTSLLLYESLRTTQKRAKVIAPLVDRLIGYAIKQKPYVAIRSINRIVTDKNASKKIMEVLADRYRSNPSGLTSITPLGARDGDGASLVEISLVSRGVVAAPKMGKDADDAKDAKDAKETKVAPKKKPTASKTKTSSASSASSDSSASSVQGSPS